jgi:hypothetical protein
VGALLSYKTSHADTYVTLKINGEKTVNVEKGSTIQNGKCTQFLLSTKTKTTNSYGYTVSAYAEAPTGITINAVNAGNNKNATLTGDKESPTPVVITSKATGQYAIVPDFNYKSTSPVATGAFYSATATEDQTIVIDMNDSYGDGWNGASIDVTVNGVNVGTATIASGSTGEFTYDVKNGDVVDFTWVSGSYDNEASYTISSRKPEDGHVDTTYTACADASVPDGESDVTIGYSISENRLCSGKNETCFAYTGSEQAFTSAKAGTYKIELWGAQGTKGYHGGLTALGGSGGYVSGEISLSLGQKIYVYIGQQLVGDSDTNTNANSYNIISWNGGGPSNSVGGAGGGATDIRLSDGMWDDASSLASRIAVAGGGGGGGGPWTDGNGGIGGSGGGLIGVVGGTSASGKTGGSGGSQTGGGISGNIGNGDTGVFGAGVSSTYEFYAGGGGGGYWGGGPGGADLSYSDGGGGGGSSFISGMTGTVAIKSATDTSPRLGTAGATCTTGTTDNLCSIHYSGLKFTNPVMIDGNGYAWTNVKGSEQQMPNPSGGYYALGEGHAGDGYARIAFLHS